MKNKHEPKYLAYVCRTLSGEGAHVCKPNKVKQLAKAIIKHMDYDKKWEMKADLVYGNRGTGSEPWEVVTTIRIMYREKRYMKKNEKLFLPKKLSDREERGQKHNLPEEGWDSWTESRTFDLVNVHSLIL